jgi:predicted permease
VLNDLRVAIRHLRRSPGLVAVGILSLGLAIAANATIFSVINSIILRPLPVDHPDQLFLASMPTEFGDDFSYPTIRRAGELLGARGDICGESTTRAVQLAAAAGVAARQDQAFGFAIPDSGQMRLVTGGCFTMLRQQPAVGRVLGPDDDRTLGGHAVAVISDRFWAMAFNRSPDAVGSVLLVNGVPLTIVGVTRPEFFGTTVAAPPPDLWAPVMMQAALRYSGNGTSNGGDWNAPYPVQREIYWLHVLLRVPGNPEAARTALAMALEQTLPDSRNARTADGHAPRVLLEAGARGASPFRERVRTQLLVLAGMVALLLILAAMNLAGVLLARAMSRHRELAIRLSIGASRAVVMREVLIESTILACAGGVLGLAVTSRSSAALVMLMNRGTPIAGLDVSPDWQVAAATFIAAAIAGVLSGAAAAWRTTRVDPMHALRSHATQTSADHSSRRLTPGAVLISAQIALCVVLLVAAGLGLRTVRAVSAIDLGFNSEHLIAARIDPRSGGYDPAQLPGMYSRVADAIAAVPGVTAVSLSVGGPLGGSTSEGTLAVEGFTPAPGERVRGIRERVVGPYVQTLGLTIIEGRDFTAADAVPGRRVSLINETMARRYFRGHAVGGRWNYNPDFAEGYDVIGVIRDAKYRTDVKVTDEAMVYMLAASESDAPFMNSVEVRVAGEEAAMIPLIRQAIHRAEPGLPIRSVDPLQARVAASAAPERLLAQLATGFAVAAVLLACLGLYGMTAYGVSRRTSEIGLRMALGAEQRRVRGMVLGESLRLVLLGSAVGLPLAVMLARAVRSQLYGVSSLDPMTYVAAAVVLIVVTTMAAYVPARRASRFEPMTALREP